MNRQFDVIIIGNSRDGWEAVKQIASATNTIKIAFISRDFKSYTTRDFLNVEYLKEEVTYVDYNRRLFCCYLKSGLRMYCTHLIIASGQAYDQFILNGKPVQNVYNTTDDISKAAKSLQAIVLGNATEDVKLALAVAKKYRHVYLCSKGLSLSITPSIRKKLGATTNIVVLPNAEIVKTIANADNQLIKVELSNYSTLTCAAIFIKTAASPETAFIPNILFKKDCSGYLETANNLESLCVPKCFATGSCARKSTKKMNQAMVETILSDFVGGSK